MLRQHKSLADALQDQSFLESLYATLTAWGLHRMGPKGAKLVDFCVMVDSFRALEQQISSLAPLTLWQLGGEHVGAVARRIWDVMLALRLGSGETKIVAGSKALHHVLPELVPPIDRGHTIYLFFHNKNLNQGDEAAFLEMFPYFHWIGTLCRDRIEGRLGRGMNTSSTKVIDNAIVGYARAVLKASDDG